MQNTSNLCENQNTPEESSRSNLSIVYLITKVSTLLNNISATSDEYDIIAIT